MKTKTQYYHGTTDRFKINSEILPPIKTDNLRENWREKYLDKVFLTNSVKSAYVYAKKAAKKFGGEPIIYKVKPVGQVDYLGNAEFIVNKAIIIDIKKEI